MNIKKVLITSVIGAMVTCGQALASTYVPCGNADGDNNTNCWSCGTTCTARLDSKGTFTISGSGDMDDYSSYSKLPWVNQRSEITSLKVESGITHLGARALHTATNLTSVELPEGLKTIGLGTFYKASGLENVTIPSSVTSLDVEAFNQAGLQTVTFADDSQLKTIGKYAFQLTHLTNVEIPNSVETIDEKAFFRTYAINNLVLPENLDSLGWEAFGDSMLKTVIIPENATYIDRTAFSYTPLENVYCSEEQIEKAICSSAKFYGVTPGYYTKNSDNTITLHKRDGTTETIANPWIKSAQTNDKIVKRIYTIEEATEALGKNNKNTFILKYR